MIQEEKTSPLNPVRYDGPPQRRYFCINYGECLDRALQKEWPGFSCSECMDYRHQEWTAADVEEDMLKCAELIKAIDTGRRKGIVRHALTRESGF